MSTTIRPELSEKNKYWIDRHRYYELKHFCLQYPSWKKSYLELDGMSKKPTESIHILDSQNPSDPTAECAMKKAFYSERIDMIDKVAFLTDHILANYIKKAVTEGWSYDILKARLEIPCCKETYYDLYRRFFWLLSKERQ